MSRMPDWGHGEQAAIHDLLAGYQLTVHAVEDGQPIPGSYWGDNEAGLRNNQVWVRNDTPLHSMLHEACHAICMGADRRQMLDTDAGGDDIEENAVCYLQICLAQDIPGYSAQQCCLDMDAWGYSFRLGSARAWFLEDAEDARLRLSHTKLLPPNHTEVISALKALQC